MPVVNPSSGAVSTEVPPYATPNALLSPYASLFGLSLRHLLLIPVELMPLWVAQIETGALVGDVGGTLALVVPATASLSGSCSSRSSSPSTLSLSLRHFQPYLVELLLLLLVGPFCRRAAVASARCLAELNHAIFVYYSYLNIRLWRPYGPIAFKATSTPAIPASLVVNVAKFAMGCACALTTTN